MVALVRRMWSNDEGQDIAEYAVMLAVILVIVVGTIRLIGTQANNVCSETASASESRKLGSSRKHNNGQHTPSPGSVARLVLPTLFPPAPAPDAGRARSYPLAGQSPIEPGWWVKYPAASHRGAG